MDDIHITTTPHLLRNTSDRILTYLGEFISSETEQAFRLESLKGDTNNARLAVFIALALFLSLLINDYLLFGYGSTFTQMVVIRIGIAIFSVVMWFVLATDSPKTFDRSLTAWAMCGAMLDMIILSTRPIGFQGPAIGNLLIVIAFYLLVPLRPVARLFLAGLITAGQLSYTLVIKPSADLPTRNIILISFVLANIIGFFTSRQLSHSRRLEFANREKLGESERHYRSLVEASGSMVWTMLPDMTVDFVNLPWIEMTGKLASKLPSEDWRLIIHPDELDEFIAGVAGGLDPDESYETVLRLMRKDGEYRWVLIRMVPLKNEAGQAEKWIGTTTDIHEHWMNKLKLVEANAQLEDALGRVKQLEKILPICMFCKKIRDEGIGWRPLDAYISSHSDTQFSHGMCDECGAEHYGELGQRLFGDGSNT